VAPCFPVAQPVGMLAVPKELAAITNTDKYVVNIYCCQFVMMIVPDYGPYDILYRLFHSQ